MKKKQQQFLSELSSLVSRVRENEGHKRQQQHAKEFRNLLQRYELDNRKLRKYLEKVNNDNDNKWPDSLKQFATVYLREIREGMSHKKFVNMCSYITYKARILLFVAYWYFFPETINNSIRTVRIPVKGIVGRAMKSQRRRKRDNSYTHCMQVRMNLVARELRFKGSRLRGGVGVEHYDSETGVSVYSNKGDGRDILSEYGPFRSYSFKYMGHIRSAYQAKQWLRQRNQTREKRVSKLEEKGINWSLLKPFIEQTVKRDVVPLNIDDGGRDANKRLTVIFKTLKKKKYSGFEGLITSENPSDKTLARQLARDFVTEVEKKTRTHQSV